MPDVVPDERTDAIIANLAALAATHQKSLEVLAARADAAALLQPLLESRQLLRTVHTLLHPLPVLLPLSPPEADDGRARHAPPG